eukprot:1161605-Pelagomonas_calceolata.AAC.8
MPSSKLRVITPDQLLWRERAHIFFLMMALLALPAQHVWSSTCLKHTSRSGYGAICSLTYHLNRV